MKVVFLVSVLLVVCSCSSEPEPTFQGKPVSEWITLADDADNETRYHAFRALSQFGLERRDVARVMIEAVRDPDPQVRMIAIETLSHAQTPTDEMIAALVSALGDDDMKIGQSATRCLEAFGSASVPALSKALDDENPVVRGKAEFLLLEIDPGSIPEDRQLDVLINALGGSKRTASDARRSITKSGQSVEPKLQAIVREEGTDPLVRVRAAVILVEMNPDMTTQDAGEFEQVIDANILVVKAEELGYDKDPSVYKALKTYESTLGGNGEQRAILLEAKKRELMVAAVERDLIEPYGGDDRRQLLIEKWKAELLW